MQRPPYPAGRHRQPGAFPRAGRRAQGRPRDRQPRRGRGRRHRRLRDAQHQAPHRHGGGAWPTRLRRATDRMFCDFAFYIGGTRENALALPELERLPGCAGMKVFMGSSTGDLLVDDDDGIDLHPVAGAPPRRLPQRGRIPLARRASTSSAPAMPRATRSGAMRKRRACAPSACCGWRASTASASMCCMSRPPTRCRCSPPTRIWRRSR